MSLSMDDLQYYDVCCRSNSNKGPDIRLWVSCGVRSRISDTGRRGLSVRVRRYIRAEDRDLRAHNTTVVTV